jgi:hypothetical protein
MPKPGQHPSRPPRDRRSPAPRRSGRARTDEPPDLSSDLLLESDRWPRHPNNHLPSVVHHSSWEPDQVEAHGFEAAFRPRGVDFLVFASESLAKARGEAKTHRNGGLRSSARCRSPETRRRKPGVADRMASHAGKPLARPRQDEGSGRRIHTSGAGTGADVCSAKPVISGTIAMGQLNWWRIEGDADLKKAVP